MTHPTSYIMTPPEKASEGFEAAYLIFSRKGVGEANLRPQGLADHQILIISGESLGSPTS